MASIRIALYEMTNDGRQDGMGDPAKRRDLGEIVLTVDDKDVRHRARWHKKLAAECAQGGYSLESLSELHQPGDGPKWAAIVKTVTPQLRKRAVTRGGKPVEDATRKPTMAARRRAGR
jgi:hypothetical protein